MFNACVYAASRLPDYLDASRDMARLSANVRFLVQEQHRPPTYWEDVLAEAAADPANSPFHIPAYDVRLVTYAPPARPACDQSGMATRRRQG